jgi:hypothetical protein
VKSRFKWTNRRGLKYFTVDSAKAIEDLEMNWPFRFDIFYHRRMWQRWEVPRGGILCELVIALSAEIITDSHAVIERPTEEKLSFVIGHCHN